MAELVIEGLRAGVAVPPEQRRLAGVLAHAPAELPRVDERKKAMQKLHLMKWLTRHIPSLVASFALAI